jgi:hypothetical protein
LGTACYSYPPPPTTEAAVDGGVGVATRCVDVQEVGTAAYLFNQLKYWKEIETGKSQPLQSLVLFYCVFSQWPVSVLDVY